MRTVFRMTIGERIARRDKFKNSFKSHLRSLSKKRSESLKQIYLDVLPSSFDQLVAINPDVAAQIRSGRDLPADSMQINQSHLVQIEMSFPARGGPPAQQDCTTVRRDVNGSADPMTAVVKLMMDGFRACGFQPSRDVGRTVASEDDIVFLQGADRRSAQASALKRLQIPEPCATTGPTASMVALCDKPAVPFDQDHLSLHADMQKPLTVTQEVVKYDAAKSSCPESMAIPQDSIVAFIEAQKPNEAPPPPSSSMRMLAMLGQRDAEKKVAAKKEAAKKEAAKTEAAKKKTRIVSKRPAIGNEVVSVESPAKNEVERVGSTPKKQKTLVGAETTPIKPKAYEKSSSPSISTEWSRNQIMCRTGKKGPGETLRMQYGAGKSFATWNDARKAGEQWLQDVCLHSK